MYEETCLPISPGSPLTPRRAQDLHTPTQPDEALPLSATLKALGAKRRTQKFTASPVPEEFADFQVLTAKREIFHLPTWVRFEANHHSTTTPPQQRRKAILDAAHLDATAARAAPKTSYLGDTAPNSPNGELFAGFDAPAPPPVPEEQQGTCVVKVLRRPTMASMRKMDRGKVTWKAAGGWKGRRAKLESPSEVVLGSPKRDGWGGITRTSWFPTYTSGPLASPTPSKPETGLKELLLQPVKSRETQDEWEDMPAPLNRESEQRSFLDLHSAPRFFHKPASPRRRRWFPTLLPRFSITPQSGQSIPLHPLNPPKPTNNPVSSHLISKTDSIENRPLTPSSRRTRIVKLAITVVLVSALVANVVVISRARAVGKGQSERTSTAFDPLVGNLPVNTAVARAAQSSQP